MNTTLRLFHIHIGCLFFFFTLELLFFLVCLFIVNIGCLSPYFLPHMVMVDMVEMEDMLDMLVMVDMVEMKDIVGWT